MLTRPGGRRTLTFTAAGAPREKVWRAVTEPEHLAAWHPQEIIGPSPGRDVVVGGSSR